MVAIAEELAKYDQHQVYEERPIEECWERTGTKPIGIRWVIVNKGDDVNPNYRARLVAKELKVDERLDLFAATPPLEAKKLLLSRAATAHGKYASEYKPIFVDIKRAYFYAPGPREIYVDLPEQRASPGKCGRHFVALPKIGQRSRNLSLRTCNSLRELLVPAVPAIRTEMYA